MQDAVNTRILLEASQKFIMSRDSAVLKNVNAQVLVE